MGLIKLSLRSLKTDGIRSLFYFAAFVLTTFFMFSFFNLTLHPSSGIHLGKDDNTFVTMIAFLIVAVAMFCVFLANNFYVEHKNKELSVILMSGASSYRLGMFLFIQSFILVILAVPFGFLLAYFSIPIINSLMSSICMDNLFSYFSYQAFIVTIVLVLFEFAWCTILNFGYCHRNSIFSVIQNKTKIETYGFSLKKMNKNISILLYFLPLIGILYYDDYGLYLSFSLIAVFGVPGILKKVIPNVLTKLMHKSHARQMIAFSFVKENFKNMTLLMNLMCISSVLLMTLIFFHLDVPVVSMIALVSYAAINVLLCTTLFFKFCMLFMKRSKQYHQLSYLGFIKEDLNSILKLEVTTFFGIVLMIPLLYHIVMLVKLLLIEKIDTLLFGILLFLDTFPLLIVFILSYYLYQKYSMSL